MKRMLLLLLALGITADCSRQAVGHQQAQRCAELVMPNARTDGPSIGCAQGRSVILRAGAKDWLERTTPATERIAQLQSLSTIGQIAILGGTRTSDQPQTGSMGAIGLAGFALNDNTRYIQTGYGVYGEARRYAGAGITQASEFNVLNGGTLVDVDPYNPDIAGLTTAAWLSSGRSDTKLNNTASVAMGITDNGAKFRRGIVIRASALDPKGPLDAMALPAETRIGWYSAPNKRTATLIGVARAGGTLNVGPIPVFAGNPAARNGGLMPGDMYRTATGQLMVAF